MGAGLDYTVKDEKGTYRIFRKAKKKQFTEYAFMTFYDGQVQDVDFYKSRKLAIDSAITEGERQHKCIFVERRKKLCEEYYVWTDRNPKWEYTNQGDILDEQDEIIFAGKYCTDEDKEEMGWVD